MPAFDFDLSFFGRRPRLAETRNSSVEVVDDSRGLLAHVPPSRPGAMQASASPSSSSSATARAALMAGCNDRAQPRAEPRAVVGVFLHEDVVLFEHLPVALRSGRRGNRITKVVVRRRIVRRAYRRARARSDGRYRRRARDFRLPTSRAVARVNASRRDGSDRRCEVAELELAAIATGEDQRGRDAALRDISVSASWTRARTFVAPSQSCPVAERDRYNLQPAH